MTFNREKMIDVVARLANPNVLAKILRGHTSDSSSGFTIDESESLREEWIAEAQIEWLDVLLDIIINPPDFSKFNASTKQRWDTETVYLLGAWGRHDPAGVLPQVGPLLTNAKIRPLIIDVLGEINLAECVPWLQPLVNHVNDLTEDELVRLTDALGGIKVPETRQLLEQMRQAVPPNMTAVHKELDIFL